MTKKEKSKVNWDEEALRTETLKWKTNARDFDKLCDYVITKITAKVVPEGELDEITTTDEIRRYVREAAERYDPDKFGNLGWYAYMRLKFLVLKWRRQHRNVHKGSVIKGHSGQS